MSIANFTNYLESKEKDRTLEKLRLDLQNSKLELDKRRMQYVEIKPLLDDARIKYDMARIKFRDQLVKKKAYLSIESLKSNLHENAYGELYSDLALFDLIYRLNGQVLDVTVIVDYWDLLYSNESLVFVNRQTFQEIYEYQMIGYFEPMYRPR